MTGGGGGMEGCALGFVRTAASIRVTQYKLSLGAHPSPAQLPGGSEGKKAMAGGGGGPPNPNQIRTEREEEAGDNRPDRHKRGRQARQEDLMGLLDLMRLMQRQRDQQQERRRRRQSQSQARDEMIAARAKRKGSPCQIDDDSRGADLEIHSGPSLPEVRHKMLIMEDLSTSQIP
ncbi:hypothetical protein HU200_030604 [Digitaria exilis]|uniref:Uncharacterized protein n=1 Tax=Digitaria exilis TaxID=1010633 RepID=A0A835BN66_9POAL|nr:hypothetical protein HU200_030604 [Digitaria exilis]